MTIVVGYVPTNEGRAALRRAADESVRAGSDVVVVRTVRPDGASYDPESIATFESELDGVVRTVEAAGHHVETREVVTSGDAADDLLEVATAVGADLIVIGLRRRTPVGKLILGSNAQRILLDAACPVLAVKAPPA